jgi:hypothetical protein
MKKLFLGLVACATLFSDPDIAPVKLEEQALATGPLLAPSPYTVPPGHVDLEPYLYVNFSTGVYNNHWEHQKESSLSKNIEFVPMIQVGVLSFMDLDLVPQFIHNSAGGKGASGIGDFGVQLGFQVLRQNHYPIALKIAIQEIFPTGAYHNLNSSLNGVDAFGSGAFTTKVTIASGYKMPLSPSRDLRIRLATSYAIPSSVHVEGPNAYGGDPTTFGDVTNAGTFDLVCGIEYSITRNWVLSMDIDSLWQHATKFKGRTLSPVGKDGSTYVLSMAPALEYNFNATYGFIGGAWFSVLGRNHTSYVNGVLAFNIYF